MRRFARPVACARDANTTTRENEMDNTTADDKAQSAKTLTTVIYALYAVALFVGITAIIAIVMNYVKRDDMAGTWLASHFRWQIRTFWFGLLWLVLGLITFVVVIGWIILAVACVWYIYRIVKGWLYLNDNKPMYAVEQLARSD
jgi:uncharacterized membrane protein